MRTDLDKNPHDAKSMLNAVVKHYGLMDFSASLRQEKFWRRATHHVVVTHPEIWILDVVAGTGADAVEFVHMGAEVVVVDFSQGTIHGG